MIGVNGSIFTREVSIPYQLVDVVRIPATNPKDSLPWPPRPYGASFEDKIPDRPKPPSRMPPCKTRQSDILIIPICIVENMVPERIPGQQILNIPDAI